MSRWFCEHYDNQIGRRYQEMVAFEGGRAQQLELERLADKRYADKARRLAAIALIEEVGKRQRLGRLCVRAAAVRSRQKQQDMFFGPGHRPPRRPSPLRRA